MKIAVIYHSGSGHTARVAQKVAEGCSESRVPASS